MGIKDDDSQPHESTPHPKSLGVKLGSTLLAYLNSIPTADVCSGLFYEDLIAKLWSRQLQQRMYDDCLPAPVSPDYISGTVPKLLSSTETYFALYESNRKLIGSTRLIEGGSLFCLYLDLAEPGVDVFPPVNHLVH